MGIVVVIPAYNEERTVGEVVRNVRAHVPDVIVVDDGSDDTTGDRARHAGATVITHCVNRGLGAALGTGLAAALGHRVLRGNNPPSLRVREGWGGLRDARNPLNPPYPKGEVVEEPVAIIITMDADGQHDPADIPAVIAPIQAGFADLVIGIRWSSVRSPSRRVREGWPPARRASRLGEEGLRDARNPLNPPYPKGEAVEGCTVPWHRRLANATANLLTRLLFGVQCSDTQSGFRAFSRRTASLIDIRTNRMEVSSEILAEAARLGLRIAEVPIRTIYTPYSLSKGQSMAVGVRTAWSLLLRRLF